MCEKDFDKLVESINAVDIWQEDSLYFEFGKVCLSMIAKSTEINSILFDDENRAFRFYLLQKSLDFVEQENGHIKLDEMIYHLKKEYLKMLKYLIILHIIQQQLLLIICLPKLLLIKNSPKNIIYHI